MHRISCANLLIISPRPELRHKEERVGENNSLGSMVVLVVSVLDGGPESESVSYGINSKISSIRSENSYTEFQFGFPSFLRAPHVTRYSQA